MPGIYTTITHFLYFNGLVLDLIIIYAIIVREIITNVIKWGEKMAKANIHPKSYEVKIICTTCTTTFLSTSTKKDEIKVDTCSKCHPFYTGEQQFEKAVGRVERFNSKVAKKEEIAKIQEKNAKAKESKKTIKTEKKQELTLEDLKATIK